MPIIILYIYKLNFVSKFWYLNKTGGRRKIPKRNSTIFLNGRLSVAKKLNFIKYTEERNLHAASNYYGVSRPTIRYWIKEKENKYKLL